MNSVQLRPPSRRARLGRVTLGLALIAAPLGGCKQFDRNSSDRPTTGSTRGDPLLGMRLPPQDVPIGGKPELARNGRDPLFTAPANADTPRRDNPTKQASAAAPGEVSSLPPRRGDAGTRHAAPYRPGPEASPAALAAGTAGDDTLSLTRGESDYDRAVRQLRAAHATWTTPVRSGSGYGVTAQRSQSLSQVGPVRKYEGTGDTPAAALLNVVEQIRADSR